MAAKQRALLVGQQLHHPERLAGMEGGEDAAVRTEIGMPHVRGLDRPFARQYDFAKVLSGHLSVRSKRKAHGAWLTA